MIWLLACAPPHEAESSAPFVETLAPGDVHLLTTSLPPASTTQGHALLELDIALQPRWSHDVADGGAMGAWRQADGSTVYSLSYLPPDFRSAIERVEPDGSVTWSFDHIFTGGLGFSHGVVVSAEGNLIATDSVGGRLVSFSPAGEELWALSLTSLEAPRTPNGIDLLPGSPERIAVSLLSRTEDGADHLALFSLTGPESPPQAIFSLPLTSAEGQRAWPHGPRFAPDGSLVICLSALGQIAAFAPDGTEQWRIPEADSASMMAFPRDAAFLPDGSLLVADGGLELLRIADPLGSFAVVDAVEVPGIFSVTPLVCAEGDACL